MPGTRPGMTRRDTCVELLGRSPTMLVRVLVAMMVIMRVMVTMTMIVVMVMPMRMVMVMLVIVMMQPLARTRAARILAEDERLDGHRHRVGRIADAAEIDVVEIPQHHAVDDEELAPDIHLVAQDVAERLRHVAVEHDVERLV